MCQVLNDIPLRIPARLFSRGVEKSANFLGIYLIISEEGEEGVKIRSSPALFVSLMIGVFN